MKPNEKRSLPKLFSKKTNKEKSISVKKNNSSNIKEKRKKSNYLEKNKSYETSHHKNQSDTNKLTYQKTRNFNKALKYNSSKKTDTTNNQNIRLNRFLSNAGICSRREADKYIKEGLVQVNGKVVTELGSKIRLSDEVKFNGQIVKIEKKVYILLNKPKDYVTTTSDERSRKTVMQLIRGACREKVFPVGRLDRNTTGVLLLTNDGELAVKLTHPRYQKKKIYHVFLDKNLKKDDLDKLIDGITDNNELLRADIVSYVDPSDKSQVGVEIHTGQNRIIRRMFEALGYKVVKLDRVYFAGLTKKGLPRGRWRFLTPTEINMLKMGAFE